jgi:hypothetical protein
MWPAAASADQRSRLRSSRLLALTLVAGIVLFLLSLPAKRRQVTGADPTLAARTVRGAFHVHTTRSDGLGDKASVAAAARDAGLQFVVFTDHGDGMRAADAPEYIAGVLCIDGVEISTDGGHYIAVGAAPSPYPLAGESAAVVEDVARLGGFGVAAHPVSLRPELAWSDWSLPVDGVEWLNADSEWRDESRWTIARAFASYPFRPPAALAMLLDRPDATLKKWDRVAARVRVVGLAGTDAHGGIGNRVEDPARRRSVRVPSYSASFRTFTTRVELDRPFTGDPRGDAAGLLNALQAGRTYTEIDAIASGATLEFTGRTAGEIVGQGSILHGTGSATFHVRASDVNGASTVAYRNGDEIARAAGTTLDFQSAENGAFRIEIHVAGAPGAPPVPWLVSNPIFRLGPAVSAPPPRRLPVHSLLDAAWRIEKSEGSEGTARVGDDGEVEFAYRLRGGPQASQFAALVADLPRNAPKFDAVSFTAGATAPSRVSVQLRFAEDENARWRKSVYVDPSARPLVVAVDDLRRVDGPAQRPDIGRASSLLFVVDLTNARPGDAGRVTFRDVALTR